MLGQEHACLEGLTICWHVQTETFDAEMEALASNVKKKGKLPARHGHLEESISRHKQHVVRLEQMLRLLDNEVRQMDVQPHSAGIADMCLLGVPRGRAAALSDAKPFLLMGVRIGAFSMGAA